MIWKRGTVLVLRADPTRTCTVIDATPNDHGYIRVRIDGAHKLTSPSRWTPKEDK